MDPISTFNETLIPYRDHLHEVWLRRTGSDKSVDQALRDAYQTAKAALEAEETKMADDILTTGSYLIECYERLVRGGSVKDLAEAEGGYNFYLRKLKQSAEAGPAPAI